MAKDDIPRLVLWEECAEGVKGHANGPPPFLTFGESTPNFHVADENSREGHDWIGNEEPYPSLEREDGDEVEIFGLWDQNKLLYRVTIHVVPNLPLTAKQRLHFSTWVSYIY